MYLIIMKSIASRSHYIHFYLLNQGFYIKYIRIPLTQALLVMKLQVQWPQITIGY